MSKLAQQICKSIQSTWESIRLFFLPAIARCWDALKDEKAGVIIIQCADWLKRAYQKACSFLLICRKKWRGFSKGRKAVIVAGSAAGLAAVLALVFFYLWNCVPLFYWWPDEIDIPVQAETRAVFTHHALSRRITEGGSKKWRTFIPNSNPSTYYRIYDENTGQMSKDDVSPFEQFEKYDMYGILPPLVYRVTVLRVRWVDYEQPITISDQETHYWAVGEMAELKIEKVFFDPRRDPLENGDTIIVSLLGRNLRNVPEAQGIEDKDLTIDFKKGYQYYVMLDTKERQNDRFAVPTKQRPSEYPSNAIYDLPDLYSTNMWNARIRVVPMREFKNDRPRLVYINDLNEYHEKPSFLKMELWAGCSILAKDVNEKDEELRNQYAEYQERWSEYIKQRSRDD